MTYFKIFCFVWVTYKLQIVLRDIAFNFSFKRLLSDVTNILECWTCFTFWFVLIAWQDLLLASMYSFIAYICDIIINKIQITKL